MSERHPSGKKVRRRCEPASSSRMRGGGRKKKKRRLAPFFFVVVFIFSPKSLLCFPVTKTSFREAAADAIELTRQSWRREGGREGDEWEQRDRLNRRLDERQLPLLLLKISIDQY